MRILVAEDDRSSRRLITALLDGLGCQVDIAENGAEAVDAVRLMPYDLVLMDLNMPGLGGLDATRAIRRMSGRRAATPIVVLTGDAFDDTRERCLAAGSNDVMLKPISEQALRDAIRSWGRNGARSGRQGDGRDAASGELLRRLGPQVFQEMVQHFREDGPRYMADLEAAFAGREYDRAADHAHRLAGAAKAFALVELAGSAGAVEEVCRSGDGPKAQVLVHQLGDRLRQALQRLERDVSAGAQSPAGSGEGTST